MPHWAATTTYAVDKFTRIRVDRRPAEDGFDSGEQRVVKSSNVDEHEQVSARLKKAFVGRDSNFRWLKDVPLGVAAAREVPRVVEAAQPTAQVRLHPSPWIARGLHAFVSVQSADQQSTHRSSKALPTSLRRSR